MNCPRWKQRDMKYQRHVQKVTEIVHNQKKTLSVDQNLVRQQQSLYNAKSFNIHFNENQRLNQINKQNQLLLDKLIDISEGKQCSFKSKQFINSPTDKSSLRAMSSKRKQAAVQIYNENQAMAQRLLNQRSFINKVQIMKEIEEYEKLRVHMQKVKPNKKTNSNILQPIHNLPPIIQPHYHQRNNTGSNLSKQRKQKKQSGNLNKSAYYLDNDNSFLNNNKIQPNLNQTEADIIINQYDTVSVQNHNQPLQQNQQSNIPIHQQSHNPPYQQSHSANIYNPANQREGFISKPVSVRSSSLMTPAIIEEDDQIENNQNQNVYKSSIRSSTQSQKNNTSAQQQIFNENFSFEKSQNVNDQVNSFDNQMNIMNIQQELQNPSTHLSYYQTQQNSNYPSQQQSLQNIQQHQNHQSQFQSNQQTQQYFNQQQQDQSQQQSQNQSYIYSQNQSIQHSQQQSQQQSQTKLKQPLQQIHLNQQPSSISTSQKVNQKLDQYQLLMQNTQK